MTKKLVWRLSKLPSVDELQLLVKDKLITQEEARGILFTEEDSEERDKKSLESEIEFLRKLVEKLGASSQTKIVQEIRYIEKPYYQYQWYQPYNTWCTSFGAGTVTLGNTSGVSSFTTTTNANAGSNNSYYCSGGTTGTTLSGTSATVATGLGNFSKIKTF